MFLSRLSRAGVRLFKENSKGASAAICRAGHVKMPYNHYSLTPPKSETKLSQGAFFQKSRQFWSTNTQGSSEEGSEQEQKISVTFFDKDGEEKHIKVPVGMSILEAANQNDIELEGACEGSLACSTCHVIVMDMEYYNKLEDPSDEENDMLYLAPQLTEMSRLGCQVIAKPELEGIRLAIPSATRNFAVDGEKQHLRMLEELFLNLG